MPHPHVLLFDGTCNLCHATVRFVLPRDHAARFKFLSIQSALGQALYRAAGLDPGHPDTLLLWTEGRWLARSDAALEIARHLGWPWRLVASLHWLPTRLRDAAYRVVASHRHQWFGRSASCLVPGPGTRGRFL